jgi:hypothetical protein
VALFYVLASFALSAILCRLLSQALMVGLGAGFIASATMQ